MDIQIDMEGVEKCIRKAPTGCQLYTKQGLGVNTIKHQPQSRNKHGKPQLQIPTHGKQSIT